MHDKASCMWNSQHGSVFLVSGLTCRMGFGMRPFTITHLYVSRKCSGREMHAEVVEGSIVQEIINPINKHIICEIEIFRARGSEKSHHKCIWSVLLNVYWTIGDNFIFKIDLYCGALFRCTAPLAPPIQVSGLLLPLVQQPFPQHHAEKHSS